MDLKSERLSTSLIKIRDSKGYTQSYIAQQLGITQKAYSYIESGRCKLEFLRFLKISKITETHPMEIINNIIPEDTLWNNNLVCFNKSSCPLHETITELKEENKRLKSLLDRFLSSDK